MKILIDYTQIPLQKVGVGIMAYNLLKELEKIHSNAEFIIIKQNDDELTFKNKNFKVKNINSKIFRNFFLRIIIEQIYIPFICYKNNIDKVHSLHYSFPLFLFKTKRIVTIHDLSFFLFPEVHKKIKVIYFKFFIKRVPKCADEIICVSKSTRNDLEKVLNKKITNATVIYNAKSQIYNPILNLKRIEEVKFKYHINIEKYILFIGTIEPRKNIYNLILSFFKYLENNLNCNLFLVIVGKKGWYYEEIFRLVNDSKYKHSIIFTGFVLEEEKPDLLKGAQAFIYPSLYEGFGIPVLEAMSCGVLTITSNVSSMPEIIKDGGILINDPTSYDEIYENIQKALSLSAEQKEKYIKRSISYSENITWHIHAKKTLDLYLK